MSNFFLFSPYIMHVYFLVYKLHHRSLTYPSHPPAPPRSGRLSRPRMTSSTERADSLSSGGEGDDEDDQFDFFTAESLFGNLMDRMKSLTKRMDMDDHPAKVREAARGGVPMRRVEGYQCMCTNA